MVPSLCEQVFMAKKCFRFWTACPTYVGLEVIYAVMLLTGTNDVIHADRTKGPLSQATGDLITTRTNAHLWQILGSTETHLYPLLLHPAAHWKHLDSHPTCVPTVTIVPGALAADQSQLYVIVQDRKADSEAGGAFQPVFDMFPSLTQSRFRDLVKKIQVEGGRTLFSYQGHIDDLLIFSNGLKVNPLNIETEVSGHILLSGSLVFGAESRECALLLERKTGRCGMK